MKIEQVDIVGAQPRQAALDAGPQPGRRQRRMIAGVGMGDARLGGQRDPLTSPLQQLRQHAFGFAARVSVGGVDVGDPRLQRGVDHRRGTVSIDGVSERHRAENQRTELHQATPFSTCRGLTPTIVVGSSAAARNCFVYASAGRARTSAVVPRSTILPAFITMMESLISLTTPRL